MPTLSGFAFDSAGVAINGATVNIYARNTTTPVVSTTSTNASGYWTRPGIAEGRYDVEIINGTTTRRMMYDDEIQIERGEFKNLQIRGSDNAFAYTLAGGAIAAARTLNLPVTTGTDTIAVLSLAQTFSVGVKTFNSSILAIRNPADTFSYTVVASAITAARNLTIPLITADDTLAVLGLAQTWTATQTYGSALLAATAPAFTTSITTPSTTIAVFNTTATTVNAFGAATGINLAGASELRLGTSTDNANMTTGLSINQGAASDTILALKSSDVAHGMTTIQETDTYAYFSKSGSGNVGADIVGLTAATRAMRIIGGGVTDNTAKTQSAVGYIELMTNKKSGTTWGVPGADANMVVIGSSGGGTIRFIFDQEGSGHADIEWVIFDSYDDLALIHDMEQHLIDRESAAGTYSRHALEAAGIIGRNSWHFENGRPRAMVNMTRLAMLHHGALIQIGERMKELTALKAEIAELRAALPGRAA